MTKISDIIFSDYSRLSYLSPYINT